MSAGKARQFIAITSLYKIHGLIVDDLCQVAQVEKAGAIRISRWNFSEVV
jgi:hypothetical protein